MYIYIYIYIYLEQKTKYRGKQDGGHTTVFRRLKFERCFYCKHLLSFPIFLINDIAIYKSINSIYLDEIFWFHELSCTVMDQVIYSLKEMCIFIDKTWLLNYFFINISLVFQHSHKFGFFIYSAFHLILPIKSGELDFRILQGRRTNLG